MSDKKTVFLRGKKVNLRPIEKGDKDNFYKWINDPDVRHFVIGTFPKTLTQEEKWIEDLDKDDKNIVFVIETKDGQPIGTMGIHRIDWKDRVGNTGALIGEKEYWGGGYGTDAKMILLDYAFNTLNLRKICSAVYSFNKRSLNYSLHCGYEVEGRRRRHIFKHGRYWDLIELGLFKEDWAPIWKKYKKSGSIR